MCLKGLYEDGGYFLIILKMEKFWIIWDIYFKFFIL